MLSSGVTILYSDFMDRKKQTERKGLTLKQLVEKVTKKVSELSMILSLSCFVLTILYDRLFQLIRDI
jgi:hypothetical protein